MTRRKLLKGAVGGAIGAMLSGCAGSGNLPLAPTNNTSVGAGAGKAPFATRSSAAQPWEIEVQPQIMRTMAEGLGFNWYSCYRPDTYPAADDEARWQKIMDHVTWLNAQFIRFGQGAHAIADKAGNFKPGHAGPLKEVSVRLLNEACLVAAIVALLFGAIKAVGDGIATSPSPTEEQLAVVWQELGRLQEALSQYRYDKSAPPASLRVLVETGYLKDIPKNPLLRNDGSEAAVQDGSADWYYKPSVVSQ